MTARSGHLFQVREILAANRRRPWIVVSPTSGPMESPTDSARSREISAKSAAGATRGPQVGRLCGYRIHAATCAGKADMILEPDPMSARLKTGTVPDQRASCPGQALINRRNRSGRMSRDSKTGSDGQRLVQRCDAAGCEPDLSPPRRGAGTGSEAPASQPSIVSLAGAVFRLPRDPVLRILSPGVPT